MAQLTDEYFQEYSNDYAFVETGTYQGDTVKRALKFGFRNIHSVELMQKFYENCVKLFENEPTVKIWHGDSPDVLKDNIVPLLQQPATFLLDAHRSGKLKVPGSERYGACPLLEEIAAIATSPIKTHTIFIDDQRLFGTPNWDYLSKEDCLNALLQINPDYKFKTLDDMIVAFV